MKINLTKLLDIDLRVYRKNTDGNTADAFELKSTTAYHTSPERPYSFELESGDDTNGNFLEWLRK